MTALLPAEPVGLEQPRPLTAEVGRSDKIFFIGIRTIGMSVLAITLAIGLFLGYQAIPTLRRYGFSFFTETQFNPQRNKVGIASAVVGTVEIAVLTILISLPLALGTALYITQYAPRKLRSALVTLVDLMAAVPSIVYGLVGFFLLEFTPRAQGVARWISQYFGFVPFFKVEHTDAHAAAWTPAAYIGSVFIASLVVSMMVVPISAAVMRGVFDQAPAGEREAAYALGATRWGMIRAVVLPFGRGGIIGGTMLGLGRALGETVAVLIIFNQVSDIKIRVLESGTNSVSALIANSFGEATSAQLSALLAAGFVLFLMTLAVNTFAGVIVTRSRSGAGTDI